MSTFEPGPEHRFAFGLPAIEPWEFVYELGDLGAWGVGVHDDDLVPCDAAPADRDDIVDKFTKALDSTGIVVSMVMTNLFEHPVFGHGAFTSPDRDVRRYAIQKTMRSIDLGAEFGARIHGLPGWREGVDSVAAKPPLDALDRYREAVDFLCAYACEQGYPTRFALECRPNEARGDAFLSTIGSALAFIDTLAHPEMVGLDPEIAHGSMRGSCGYHGVAQAIDASCSTSTSTHHRSTTTSRSRVSARRARTKRSSWSSCWRIRGMTAQCSSTSTRATSMIPRASGTSSLVACAPTGPSPPRSGVSLTTPRSVMPWPSAAHSSWPNRPSGRSPPRPAGR
jgi:hypothetical protein